MNAIILAAMLSTVPLLPDEPAPQRVASDLSVVLMDRCAAVQRLSRMQHAVESRLGESHRESLAMRERVADAQVGLAPLVALQFALLSPY